MLVIPTLLYSWKVDLGKLRVIEASIKKRSVINFHANNIIHKSMVKTVDIAKVQKYSVIKIHITQNSRYVNIERYG